MCIPLQAFITTIVSRCLLSWQSAREQNSWAMPMASVIILRLITKRPLNYVFWIIYTTYGINISDHFLGNPGAKRVNFIPTGSTSFKAISNWNKTSISIENISLFYPSGPLMDFMGDLQEISTEKNLAHRLQVLDFLNHLLIKYNGLKNIL